jgi:hypothetical protein
MAAMSAVNSVRLIVGVLFTLALLFVAVWLLLGMASLVARSVRRWWQQPAPAPAGPAVAYGFPVIAHPVLPVQAFEDGSGRYRIVGVVRETLTDVKMHVQAETLANAKAKAELMGVLVTEITKTS